MLAGKYYPSCKNERNQCKTQVRHEFINSIKLSDSHWRLPPVYMCVCMYIITKRCACFFPRGKMCILPDLGKSGCEGRFWRLDGLSSCGASGNWRLTLTTGLVEAAWSSSTLFETVQLASCFSRYHSFLGAWGKMSCKVPFIFLQSYSVQSIMGLLQSQALLPEVVYSHEVVFGVLVCAYAEFIFSYTSMVSSHV